MTLRCAPLLLMVLLVACTPTAAPLAPVPAATPTPVPPPVQFPRDADPHDALTEWWYFTGHLRTADAREFGFEFTVFQSRREGTPAGYLAHFAVTDVHRQGFSHQARFVQAEPRTGFPLEVADWRLEHDGQANSISAHMRPAPTAEPVYGLSLRFEDTKPPALHNGGYIDMGPAGGSYYYSRTRLRASGSLAIDGGSPLPVEGQAWMDHQWGNFVVAGKGGWDWYSLQLDDQTEVMLYIVRGVDGVPSAVYGSFVEPNGTVRDLGMNEVSIEATDQWLSPHTGARYPSGWNITLGDGVRLVVKPRVLDQELFFGDGTPSPTYWEGAVTVSGDRQGLGYVELTGYAS